jgi:hypothetical protein
MIMSHSFRRGRVLAQQVAVRNPFGRQETPLNDVQRALDGSASDPGPGRHPSYMGDRRMRG